MPTSFKHPIIITVYTKTPDEELEFCIECGGINAMARTAVKIDCTACGTTGYSNPYRTVQIPAYYTPRALKRWDHEAGAISYDGEASIKIDNRYGSLMESATHVEFEDVTWQFRFMREPGAALGQRRLVFSLTRKE